MSTLGPDNRGVTLVVLAWCLLGLSSLIVGLRAFVRITRVNLAADDYFIFISWLCALLHTIFITVAWQHGLGRHFQTLTPDQQQTTLYYTAGYLEIFAIVTCMFGRISFCILLLHIIGPSDKIKKWTLWSVIAVQLAITTATVVQIYAQCGSQVTALWDYSVAAQANCQSPQVQTIIGFVQSGINSLCDVVLTVTPVMILWNLQMPTGQKIGLGAMLTLSIFAFAASVVKAYEIHNLSAKNDFTWYFIDLQIWVVVENNVVMMAASIPTLAPILRRRQTSNVGRTVPLRYNRSGRSGGKDKSREQHSSKPGDPGQSSTETNPKGASQEYILQTMSPDEQITKRTDVQISYESRSDAEKKSTTSEKDEVPEFLRQYRV